MSIRLEIEVVCAQLGIDIDKFIQQAPKGNNKPEIPPPKSSS